MFKGNEGAPNAKRKRREIPHFADSVRDDNEAREESGVNPPLHEPT